MEKSASAATLPPLVAATSEPSDAALQQGVLDALRSGLGDVAKVLAAQLEERLDERRRAGGKVIDIRRGRGEK